MSTTAQQVVDRATARNIANQGLTADANAMLAVINREQYSIRAQTAAQNRTFYQTSATLTSTAGSSGRTVDLSTLTSAPVYRVLLVTLSDGTEVAAVDVQDTNAELAPRYYQRGRTLVEVGSDWSSTSASAQSIIVYYVKGVAALDDTASDLTQTVGIEDEFVDLLDNRLARHLALADVNRDDAEVQGLDTEYARRFGEYVDWLNAIAGRQANRFDLASPEVKK